MERQKDEEEIFLSGQKFHEYDDIIHLPHPISATHPQMSRMNRAVQFSPFAALTGYGDAVQETARLTDAQIELDDSRREELNRRLQILDCVLSRTPSEGPAEALSRTPDRALTHTPATGTGQSTEPPCVTVTYFSPDERKEGGSYRTQTGIVKKIDSFAHVLVLEDGTRIPMENLTELTGDWFETLE